MALYCTVKCSACGALFTSDNDGKDCVCPACGNKHAERAETIRPLSTEAGRLMFAADAALYSQKFGEAAKLYKKALKQDKKNPVPHFALALCKRRIAVEARDGKIAYISLTGKPDISVCGEFKKAFKLADEKLCKAFTAFSVKLGAQKRGVIEYDPDEFCIMDKRLVAYNGNAQNVVIPDGVTMIESNAFFMCETVKSVHIPDSVKTVEYGAFTALKPIERITVDERNDFYAGVDGHLVDVINRVLVRGVAGAPIPENVYAIADCAYQTSDITSVVIPNGTVKIGERAFGRCDKLEYVEIPSSVVDIDERAFEFCGAIEEFTVAAGNRVYCEADGCLYMPQEDTVVRGCADGVIPASAETIGAAAYSGCEAERILIPASVKEIEDEAFCLCENLAVLEVDERNDKYVGVGNCVLMRYTRELVLGCAGSVIPEDAGITEICAGAFEGATKLERITLPRGITVIGEYAFKDCEKLCEINLPDTLTTVCNGAFEGCDSLTTIVIPASVCQIGNEGERYGYVFEGCDALDEAVFINPEGWMETDTEYGECFPQDELENTQNAAALLRDGVCLMRR